VKDSKKTITGEISAIRFRNSEGWSVFSLQDEPIGFTGTLADMVDIGTEVTCTGKIEMSKFGSQMKCETIVPAAPDVSTDAGVIKLLQRLPGIGPKKAMMAVLAYGHEGAWNLALDNPAKIGVKKEHLEAAQEIAETLIESYEATVYLLGIGLTGYQAKIIYEVYQGDTIQVVSEDPYKLIKIDGFGFKTVDKIALKAGISVGNPSRIAACILFVLDDSASNGGHIWHNGWSLADTVLETLTQTAMKAEVSMVSAPDIEEIRKQVHFLSKENRVHIKVGRVYSLSLLSAETTILDYVEGAL